MRATAMFWIALLAACTTGLGAGCEPQGQQPQAPRAARPLAKVEAPKDLGADAYAHVEKLVAMGARHVGSKGYDQQLDYICRQLQAIGLEPVRDTWTDDGEKLSFTNVVVTLPGKQRERIVIGAHHDTKRTDGHQDPRHNFAFVGANDGGSGVGLLLALAPVLKAQPHAATIELVFFDGEESLDWEWNHGARALYGSKRFVKQYRDGTVLGSEDRIAAFVLLDMVGRTDLHIQEETNSTAALRDILWSAAVACGHRDKFFKIAAAASDDHTPFLDAGIPSVDLLDLEGNPHWHKPTDTLANISAASLQAVGEVVLTMLPEVEREYLPRRHAGR